MAAGPSEHLPLEPIAEQLEFLEETLIYHFLNRIQYSYIPELYEPEAGQTSLLEHRLRAHEAMDQRFGRYSAPEEFPFTQAGAGDFSDGGSDSPVLKQLQPLQRPENRYPFPFAIRELRQISQTKALLKDYIGFIKTNGSAPLKKERRQPGSALEYDVAALQALSQRIHYGALHIAEVKFLQRPEEIHNLVQAWRSSPPDLRRQAENAVLEKITRPKVEEKILTRVYEKTRIIQQTLPEDGDPPNRRRLDPEAVRQFYWDCVIPLTKRGELAYLHLRCPLKPQ